MVKNFQEFGTFSHDINHVYLVITQKVQNPTKPDHFRLISLLNISYKIISKLLKTRIQLVINKITPPLQSTILKGRAIHDNILLAQELFYHIYFTRNDRIKKFILKLDMQKAYE